MTATIQARPTTSVTGYIELTASTNPRWAPTWSVVTVNQAGYEHRMGGYADEAKAQRVLDRELDSFEAEARRETAVVDFLTEQVDSCDQCGSKLPATGRCASCQDEG